MHVQGVGYGLLNSIEKLPKFFAPMSAMDLTDDSSCFYFQSSKQRRRAVPGVVMTTAFRLTGPHGKHRLRSIQRLDLRFFVDAQHQGPVGWIQIQPHDVSNFLDE